MTSKTISQIVEAARAAVNIEALDHFDSAEPQLTSRAERGEFPVFGYTTAQRFESAEAWLEWKLTNLVEELNAEVESD